MTKKLTADLPPARRMRITGTVALLALVALCWVGTAAVSAQALMRIPAASSAWATAQEVPGSGALNSGGNAGINSISCASPGNCSAGGYYENGTYEYQAFVVSEVNGVWQKAKEVPGSAALNTSGNAGINSISCPSAGNCSAGGYYQNGTNEHQAFVVSEVNGVWQKAIEVPGSAALNTSGNAGINSISCPSAGNCSAGGFFKNAAGEQAFAVSEIKGVWKKAQGIPGTTSATPNGVGGITSISCASPGNCSGGGDYSGTGDAYEVFVVSEVKGVWKKAEEVPGTAALNTGAGMYVHFGSISCASAGNCSAGGVYDNTVSGNQMFVVNEVKGVWRTAIQVPGTAALDSNGFADFESISCASAGNCSGGGYYSGTGDAYEVFVVSEVNGVWQKAIEVPGSGALNTGGDAGLYAISCPAAGYCSAGGIYHTVASGNQAFVVSEVKGVWQKAIEVPGSGALNSGGDASVYAISCPSIGHCSAAGSYYQKARGYQAFVVKYQPTHD